MWKKLSNNPYALAVLSGIAVFLAFEKFCILPAVLFFPVFFNPLLFGNSSLKRAFGLGFLTSFIVMLGGFYWVTYVIHEFGYLPWSVSALLFLGFCGFGALNFPLFATIATYLHRKASKPNHLELWLTLGLPALFAVIEWLIPKLFPWYLGHCLYSQVYLIQMSEWTGSIVLSFALYSLGSALGAYLLPPVSGFRPSSKIWIVPAVLWALQVGAGVYAFNTVSEGTKKLNVGLIQANIGSLEKMASEQGLRNKVQRVLTTYQTLSEEALAKTPKPDLLLWPETALPFQLESPGKYQDQIRQWIMDHGTPVIAGAYAQSPKNFSRDYNAAFLMDPKRSLLPVDMYPKNILLAFGEYFPGGELFPSLYKMFPQVSDFERGTDTHYFELNGNRLGLTLCYEAIVPSFARRVAQKGIHAFVNLTNDSWFGPTSEPYLHASLTVFRSVEARVPLIRVTNTGTSFVVDSLGRRSPISPVYEPSVQVETVSLPDTPPQTFYVKFGDWFILLLLGFIGSSYLQLRKKD